MHKTLFFKQELPTLALETFAELNFRGWITGVDSKPSNMKAVLLVTFTLYFSIQEIHIDVKIVPLDSPSNCPYFYSEKFHKTYIFHEKGFKKCKNDISLSS